MVETPQIKKEHPHTEHLFGWTIYDHPRDFPNGFVARKWMTLANGNILALQDHYSDPNVELVREYVQRKMIAAGNFPFRFVRHPMDDPVILETWM